ncbi:MAG: hypothetical protein MUC36_08905 [Planctomycetes bacterium]|jgi:hypothetical protein|nr:hypothetical protein [Planctomycetota bacterium]
MRSFLTAALLAAAAIAQSPLSMPYTSNNGGGSGWQIFFDLNVLAPTGITLTSLDVNCGTTAVGTTGTVEIWTGPTTHVGNETNASLWSLAVSGGVIAQGSNLPSPTCLGAGLYLAPGPHAISVRHLGVSLRYTDGTGSNQTGATNELTFTGGSVTSAFFSGSFFTPRVFNGSIYYNVGAVPGTGCAQTTSYGTGCYRGTTTFHETFASLAAFDFAGAVGAEQVIAGTPIPGGYLVTPGAPAWFAPLGTPVLSNAATPAAMGDNNFSGPLALPFVFAFPGGSTSVIHAASNGFVNLGVTTTNVSDGTPTAAELIAQAARLCPLWCDLQPATNVSTNPASGIYFDVDPSGQSVYVTWLDVADRRGSLPAAGATSVNVQLALHASGGFEFRYRAMVPNTTAGAVIVGFSKGNTGGPASIDPGSVDLSASLPLLTSGPDSRPIVHTVGLPRLGTNFVLSASDVENVVPLALLFVGDTVLNPGIDLGFVGAAGCSAYSNANLASATFVITAATGTGSFTLPIPNDPLLIGLALTSQVAAFTTKNAFGIGTSNGVQWTVGN